MIQKVSKGKGAYGLVRYLVSENGEHENPRLVAGCAEALAEINRPELAARDVAGLARVLDEQRLAHGLAREGSVWHCSLSVAPEDGVLTDEQWRTMAGEFVAGMGFEDCRWIAIRHGLSAAGNDHAHLVVVTTTIDGRQARLSYDFVRAQTVCRTIEKQHGLRVLTGHGHDRGWSKGERALDGKRGRGGELRGSRDTLERLVRAAAQAATDELDFTLRLREHGVDLQPRYEAGRVVGASYRLPGPRTGKLAERWWSGGKLGADLSLGRLRKTWGQDLDARRRALRGWSDRPLDPERLAADDKRAQDLWNLATETLRDARVALESPDAAVRAAVCREAAGVLCTLSIALEGDEPGELARRAKDLARASDQAAGLVNARNQRVRRRSMVALAGALSSPGRKRSDLERVGRGLLSLAVLRQARRERKDERQKPRVEQRVQERGRGR